MNKIFRYSKGVLLLEAAIALIVISLAMGGMLMVLNVVTKTQSSTVTARIAALKGYYAQEGHLPCPSQPVMDDGFAPERCRGPVAQIGIVPYKTLGISASLIKDGHGNVFTYAVSEGATLTQEDLGEIEPKNELVILDRSGRKYGRGHHGTAFVLITHAPHGSGAFTMVQGRERRPVSTEFERENASESLSFYVDVPQTLSTHTVAFVPLADLASLVPTRSQNPKAAPVSESDPYGITDE